MRVTGDAFPDGRRFAADLGFAFEPVLVALFRLGPRVFAAPFARLADLPFDAVVVFPRAFLRDDDFDTVAMIDSSGKVRLDHAQDSRTAILAERR